MSKLSEAFQSEVIRDDIFHPGFRNVRAHLPRHDENWIPPVERDRLQLAVAALTQRQIRQARNHFPSFAEFCFCNEKTGYPFRQQWFHDEWSSLMDTSNRAIIVAPRDHGKTSQIVARTLWELGRDPNLRIKIACASDGRAKERLFEIVQNLMYNPRVLEVFPHLRQAESGEWSKHKIIIDRPARYRDASVEALGITATATGGRCDLLIADDVVDRRNALSFPALREQIKQAWKADWTNLLEPDSRIWYICTLWHKDDLSHELMANRAYKTLFYAVPENFGSLWPEKWDSASLYKRYQEIGSIEFNRAFRNVAVDLENATIRPEWIQYSDLRYNDDFLSRLDELIFFTAYDTAGTPSGNARQDYAAEVVMAVDVILRRVYVVSAEQYRKTVKGQGQRVIKGIKKYKPYRAIVEKASQAAVDEWVEELAPELAAACLEVCKPTKSSKMEKLMGITPLLESGVVVFNASLDPDGESWNPTKGSLVDQLIDFPFAKHDDMADAFTICLHAIRRYFLDRDADGQQQGVDIQIGPELSRRGFVL